MCSPTSLAPAKMLSGGLHSCGAVKEKGQWQIEECAEKQSDKMFRKQGLS